MELLLNQVNWVAVLTGGILAFALGWLWYSKSGFGTRWAADLHINMQDGSSGSLAMLAQAAGTFLLAWAIGVADALGSIPLAILIGLALTALIKANGLFAQKSRYAISVEAGYIVAMVAVMVVTHMFL